MRRSLDQLSLYRRLAGWLSSKERQYVKKFARPTILLRTFSNPSLLFAKYLSSVAFCIGITRFWRGTLCVLHLFCMHFCLSWIWITKPFHIEIKIVLLFTFNFFLAYSSFSNVYLETLCLSFVYVGYLSLEKILAFREIDKCLCNKFSL